MRLFVIVRRDLPTSVRACQAIHAATNLVHGMKIEEWGHYGPNLVLLGCKDESELESISADMERFYEPDLGDELTAAAYLGEYRDCLKGLRLL